MKHHSIEDLIARAAAWRAADPDPVTATELDDVLAAVDRGDGEAVEDLASRFSGPLEFGTAGLRAGIGAGESRMNIAVVRRTAAGITRFLAARAAAADEAWTPRVVIGFDARHRSADFAEDSARVFTAAGFETLLMPTALPTPVLAWAVRALDADAGVMVTASHNPKEDNGYKVYVGGRVEPGDGRGAQIVPPVDAEIASAIDWDEDLTGIDLAADGWTVLPAAGEDGDIERGYVDAVVALSPASGNRDLRLVTTAMHGVGGHTLAAVLDAAGFGDVHVVAEQEEPDPDFPTVTFPNPEEEGAMDRALALAAQVDADLVVANDPDADRCSAAIPTPDGGWRQLRGDEVGILLGSHVLERALAAGNEHPVLANSIVSSRQLGTYCASRGVEHHETLTGFKWIARIPGLVFGFEEALGYDVAPDITHDKDGISATLLLAELAQGLKDEGTSLQQALDATSVRDGFHLTEQISIRVKELSERDVLLDRLGSATPSTLGGVEVSAAEDMADGIDGLPATAGMRLLLRDDTRVIVRPSGTEPKLKCYLEVIEPVADTDDLARARDAATERLAAVKADLSTALGL